MDATTTLTQQQRETGSIVSRSTIRGAAAEAPAYRESTRAGTSNTFVDARGRQPNAVNRTASTIAVERHAPTNVDARSPRITGMHKWEGTVVEVFEDSFTARLLPIDHAGSELHADFDVTDLADDGEEVQEGDVFYLTVRSVRGRGRKSERTAALRLRRLGRWSAQELENAKERADARATRIGLYAE